MGADDAYNVQELLVVCRHFVGFDQLSSQEVLLKRGVLKGPDFLTSNSFWGDGGQVARLSRRGKVGQKLDSRRRQRKKGQRQTAKRQSTRDQRSRAASFRQKRRGEKPPPCGSTRWRFTGCSSTEGSGLDPAVSGDWSTSSPSPPVIDRHPCTYLELCFVSRRLATSLPTPSIPMHEIPFQCQYPSPSKPPLYAPFQIEVSCRGITVTQPLISTEKIDSRA